MWHTNFGTTSPTAAFDAPVTEIAPLFFPADIDRSLVEAKVAAFAQGLVSELPAEKKPLAHAVGWVVEEIDHEKAEGGKAIRYVLTAGWESVEQHLSGREEAVFTEGIKPVRALVVPPIAGLGLFHAKLTKFEP